MENIFTKKSVLLTMNTMKYRLLIFTLLFAAVSVLFFCIGVGQEWKTVFSLRINIYLQSLFIVIILAYGGRILQTLLLNPLAEPYILGVSSAAALGAITAVFSGFSPASLFRALFSLAAAGGVSLLIYLFSRKKGGFSIATALLAGVGFNALFSSWIMLLQSLLRPNDLQLSIRWLMGNIDVIDSWEMAALGLGAGMVLAYYLAYHREMDVYLSGEETALASGVDTDRLKRRGFLVVSLATGLAISISGMIGFLGLVVPHLVRMVFGHSHAQGRLSLFILGGLVMVMALSLSRFLIPGTILSIGMLTSLIGAPFFIILLFRIYLPGRQI